VGLCQSPRYLNYERGTSSIGNGTVTAYLYLPEESFESEAYHELLLTADIPGEIYSDEYNNLRDALETQIEDFFEARQKARYDDAVAEAKDELADARRELDDGWADYEEGKEEAEQELSDALTELEDAKSQLDEAEQQIEDAKAQAEELETMVQAGYVPQAQLDAVLAEIEAAEKEYENGWSDYKDGLAEYVTGKKEADEELADALTELNDGEAEYADGEQELADLKAPTTYVLNRDTNIGYASFESNTDIMEAIAQVFPVFFFLVAAFVCVTTMARMVEEDRTEIGTLKALGYSNGQIISGYLIYAGSAALIGWVLGYGLGTAVICHIICKVYQIMFWYGTLTLDFSWKLYLACLAAALACSVVTVVIALRSELRETAAGLIRPKSARPGKRILLERMTPLWSRLSFLRKVSLRNIFRYKSRLFMMLLGIGGCTALMITGFGLKDSIQDVVDLQYSRIQHYDLEVIFDADEFGTDELTELESATGVDTVVSITLESVDVKNGDTLKSTRLLAGEDDLETMFTLYDASSTNGYGGTEQLSLPKSGESDAENETVNDESSGAAPVLLSYGMSRLLGAEIGDELTLYNEDNEAFTVQVAGIFENYTNDYILMTNEAYEQCFGTEAEANTLLIGTDNEAGAADSDGGGGTADGEGLTDYEIAATLTEINGVESVSVSADFSLRMVNMLGSLDLVVALVVVCAAALAFIVMYNLTNINIAERIREIATLKVLGFYANEVRLYVFREILMLAAMGALVGIPLGHALHAYIMAQIKVDLVFFPTIILARSVWISLGLTMLFTVLILLFMRPKLARVDMVESLKSIE